MNEITGGRMKLFAMTGVGVKACGVSAKLIRPGTEEWSVGRHVNVATITGRRIVSAGI